MNPGLTEHRPGLPSKHEPGNFILRRESSIVRLYRWHPVTGFSVWV